MTSTPGGEPSGQAGPVIVAARRTPVRTSRPPAIDPVELAAPVLSALAADLRALAAVGGPTAVGGLTGVGGLARPEARGAPDSPSAVGVDDVVLGSARGPGGNLARVAALAAGLGVHVPGVTVDRQCGSGLEAIRAAAAAVGAGQADVVLAGGVESASAAEPGRAAFAPAGFPDPDMGPAAEDLARVAGIGRERQDAYALRSHRLAVAARDRGVFDAELVPAAGATRDDRPRPRLTASLLARFPPAFASGGTVTAGNSCGISDGAAAVAVISERVRAALGVPGLRILATSVVGVDPALPGLGPVPAIRDAVRRSGIGLDQVDVVEITEAFAAQVLACTDALGLDPLGADAARVCPDGGAIGLGHPWAASGALLAVRLFSRLVLRAGGRWGVAGCAIGGGQGIALVVERVGP